MWHDRWWDPARAAHIPVDVVGLVFSLMQDPRQWFVIPQSVAVAFVKTGQFVIQQLLDPPPERVCYKITHRNIKPSVKKSLDILNQYMTELFKKGEG
jgi:hypothetical protein